MNVYKLMVLLVIFLFAKDVFALKCELNEYDFGLIKEGDKVKHEFEIQNNTSKNISIKRIIAECSCVSSSKKEIHLKPNEITFVDITFNSIGYGGRNVKKDILLIDESGFQLDLTIKGTVKGIPPEERLGIMPLEISMFNDLDEKREIIIEPPAKKNVEIRIEAPKWMNCKLKKQERKHSEISYVYILECSLAKLLNVATSVDIYILTDLPHFEKIPIRIHIEQKPIVIVSPPVLFIKAGQAGQLKDEEFQITFLNSLSDKKRATTEMVLQNNHSSPSNQEITSLLIEPSNKCIVVDFLETSEDYRTIKYKAMIRDCKTNEKLHLKLIYEGQCIQKIPVVLPSRIKHTKTD